ncbi:MAG: NAD(P)H-dependent oxidoreductase [Ferruginibacter sp.]
MITIISGTNRKDSYTKKVALEYQRFLAEQAIENKVLALDEYDMHTRDEQFVQTENDFLKAATGFIIILPEYNGSYPGVFKTMIDNTDVPNVWWHKKVLLTGVSSGRAGNLRGMEHITGSLLHMKMTVHPNRLPLSVVNTLMNEDDIFTDIAAISAIKAQINEFLGF